MKSDFGNAFTGIFQLLCRMGEADKIDIVGYSKVGGGVEQPAEIMPVNGHDLADLRKSDFFGEVFVDKLNCRQDPVQVLIVGDRVAVGQEAVTGEDGCDPDNTGYEIKLIGRLLELEFS